MAPNPSPPPPPLLLLLCLIAIIFFGVDASVHDYAGERFANQGNAYILHGGSEGLYASPLSRNPSDPALSSFIRFEKIVFKRPKAATDGAESVSVRAIIFEVEDREAIGGSAYGGQRAICCTSDLAKIGACTEGAVIYRPSNRSRDWPQAFSASFTAGDLEATLPSQTIQITETGMYNLYFIYCDPSLDGLAIEGKTIWKNPTGYLPGRMAPLMNFYGFMSLAFVVLGICWFYQYARFWREVMPLQNCITLVITLGMFEMTLWYFDFVEFNKTGVRPAGTTFWAATFAVVKRTVSRVLILLVSMGFGVVRPTLGGLTSKVVLLGGTFFSASEVLEVVENVGIVSDQSGKAKLFFVLPVAVLDASFIIWIFTSLARTLNKLQARRMTAKLEIYRKFTNALIVAVIVSLGWIAYEIYFKSTDMYNERWQSAWVVPALWQFISFSLLCVICILWAPSQNSMRFAYSDDGSEDFDHEDTGPLIRPVPFSYKDSFSYSISQDAKLVLRTDATLGSHGDNEEDKRE
ncbi:transmembrane protein 87A-like [Ananas comosus]|uniref:Transmembrane protein 87A n=1 Tax=Ananas comosus TaxID=4615 RepID=A0A199VH33_ANACO|nr:transmembrane protein 87A-like [Ananas comosus]OAY76437.1 Transmembrane protein 87A [Ananas comosus]